MNRYIILFCAAILAAATGLHAQGPKEVAVPDTSSYLLNEAMVASFRESGEVKKIPASVSVVTSERIERNRVETLRNLTSIIPNYFMPDYGSQLTAPVFIRGIGSRINAPSVGLYVDYIPYFDKASFDFDLYDISRIEVLRGPQGTLYGRNTMGGIINVFSLSPLTYQGLRASVSGGNYGFADATLSYYGKIGENTGFSLSGNYLHKGGYFTNEYNGDKVGVVNSWSGKARFVHKFSDNFRAELYAQYEHSEQDGYPYELINKKDASKTAVNYNDTSLYNRDLFSAGMMLEWKTPDFVLRSTTSYQLLDDEQVVDQDYSPLSICKATQTQHQNSLSQELIMKSNDTRNYQWLFGLFGFWQGADKDVFLDYGQDAVTMRMIPTLMSQDMLYNQPVYGWAVFHQSTWSNLLMNGLSLSAGIRVDGEYAESDDSQIVTIKASGVKTTTQSDTKLDFIQALPKVALNYEFKTNNSVYASIAKGYKTGGFNVATEKAEDKTFEPEYSWNYEVGAKLNLFNKRLTIDAALFYIDWHNQQVYQFNPSGRGSLLRNAGHSASKGFELALNARPFSNLQLSAAYGYTHASYLDYKSTKGSIVCDSTGNFVPYVPQNTVSIGVNYTWNINAKLIDNVVLHAQYVGAGAMYWDDANLHKQDYYDVYNARVSFNKSIVELSFWIQNIFDKQYQTFYFEALGNSYQQLSPPRLFGVDLKLRF